MDQRTTAEAARDAAKAVAALFAVKDVPRVEVEAKDAARLIIAAMAESDPVASEALCVKAVGCSMDAPEIHDLLVDGADAVRRFTFLAETGGR